MGRGRKGFLNQSTKKLNPKRHQDIAMILGLPDKRDETKISLQEDAFEFMKMNQQELVDFLLSNAVLYDKTSSDVNFKI